MTRILLASVVHPTSEVERRYPDLGLGYLAATLRQEFGTEIDIRIVDRDYGKALAEYKPDLVGLRSVSQNYNEANKIAQMAHQAQIPLLMGGIHITALPQSLDRHMTLGCLGEGEETIVELVRLFIDKGKLPLNDLEKIPGVCLWDGDKLMFTPHRPLIANLNAIPLPARDLLPIKSHTYMFTSRGCPYRCRFCASSAYWNKLRFFSADYVVNEIGTLVEDYKVKFITFYDDMFVSDVSRLKEIATGLDRSGLLKKVKFSCSCSAPNITNEVAQILKEMNIVSVGMGLESGSDKILNYLKGKTFSVQKNRDALEILKEHRITGNASFVIGSPEETLDDIMETYRFIKESPVCLVDVYVLTPYPGTAIWDYALAHGLVTNEMDWERLNVNFEVSYHNAILLSKQLTREEIVNIYKKFRRQRLWRNLKNIWWHPFLIDLPKVVINTLIERVYRKFH
jgi:radical SAM superfamily enzyme YgiQ (UPF0313 family)